MIIIDYIDYYYYYIYIYINTYHYYTHTHIYIMIYITIVTARETDPALPACKRVHAQIEKCTFWNPHSTFWFCIWIFHIALAATVSCLFWSRPQIKAKGRKKKGVSLLLGWPGELWLTRLWAQDQAPSNDAKKKSHSARVGSRDERNKRCAD